MFGCDPKYFNEHLKLERIYKTYALWIGHFIVVCLVTWSWTGSEAGGDLVLLQTSLLFICRLDCSYAN